jgi:pyrroloquinoline quinone (PQQ) biosynthesis protein C
MSSQFYSLKALKARVDSMIKEQGEDAPVAWWIFTSEDVIIYDNEGHHRTPSDEVCGEVLSNLQEYDHIYEEIGDAINAELDLKWLESNNMQQELVA